MLIPPREKLGVEGKPFGIRRERRIREKRKRKKSVVTVSPPPPKKKKLPLDPRRIWLIRSAICLLNEAIAMFD